MTSSKYFHQIICLNGASHAVGKYQFQIAQINRQGQLVQRARWNFHTIKGLLAFVQKHFPDSDLLRRDLNECIQFQVVPTLATYAPTMPQETEKPKLAVKIVATEPGMPSQFHPDREILSTLPTLATASCG